MASKRPKPEEILTKLRQVELRILQFLSQATLLLLVVIFVVFGVFNLLFSDECDSEMGYREAGVCTYE